MTDTPDTIPPSAVAAIEAAAIERCAVLVDASKTRNDEYLSAMEKVGTAPRVIESTQNRSRILEGIAEDLRALKPATLKQAHVKFTPC